SYWSEKRGGDGSGEFVVFRAPRAVPMVGFNFRVRPTQSPPATGVAPSTAWIALDQGLYHVTLPPDAWNSESGVFSVRLPAPVESSCVALVLDSAGSGKAGGGKATGGGKDEAASPTAAEG